MARRQSMFTDLVGQLREELEEFRERAEPDVPFMHERVKPSVARKHLFAMKPGDRKRMADQMSQADLMKLLRGGGK